MKTVLYTLLILLSFTTASEACSLTASNLTLLSDDGVTGTYTIDLTYSANGNEDASDGSVIIRTATTSAVITAGGGPHACQCDMVTYQVTFTAPLNEPVEFAAYYDQPNGVGNSCQSSTLSVPLPVDYVFINGDNHQRYNQLTWMTAQEINNNGFYIQKSIDGYNYKTVDFIKGGGTTSLKTQYDYLDHEITDASVSYYRLNQEDFDGGNALSKVIMIKNGSNESVNSFSQLNDMIYFDENASSVELYNTAGNKVLSTNNVTELSTLHIAQGIYILRVNQTSSKIFIK